MRRPNLFGGVAGLKEFSQNRIAGGGVFDRQDLCG
jgi:hypothetical protein